MSFLENKLKELNLKYRHGFVEYYDKDKVDRRITLFEKPLEFEYQKEFRFYVERPSEQLLIFSIGSLTEIAEIHPSEGVIDTLELTTKEKPTANG